MINLPVTDQIARPRRSLENHRGHCRNSEVIVTKNRKSLQKLGGLAEAQRLMQHLGGYWNTAKGIAEARRWLQKLGGGCRNSEVVAHAPGSDLAGHVVSSGTG